MFDQSGGFGSSQSDGGGDGGGFNSPGENAKANRTRVQNLVPCTINQIRTANKEDDRFLIGTMELGQVGKKVEEEEEEEEKEEERTGQGETRHAHYII